MKNQEKRAWHYGARIETVHACSFKLAALSAMLDGISDGDLKDKSVFLQGVAEMCGDMAQQLRET